MSSTENPKQALAESTFTREVDRHVGTGLNTIRENYPNRNISLRLHEFKKAAFEFIESMMGFDTLHAERYRFAELKINVKQDASRRIPPGRDPGSGGAW